MRYGWGVASWQPQWRFADWAAHDECDAVYDAFRARDAFGEFLVRTTIKPGELSKMMGCDVRPIVTRLRNAKYPAYSPLREREPAMVSGVKGVIEALGSCGERMTAQVIHAVLGAEFGAPTATVQTSGSLTLDVGLYWPIESIASLASASPA